MELEHDGPTLITPPVTFMLRHDQHAVHSACWSILNSAVLSKDISHRWLGSIREIFEDLEPHFAEIQWPERPEFLEGSWQSIPAPEVNKLDSSVIGYTGNLSLSTTIEEFRGLRIALDDYGFLSLQVKDGKSWQLHTCGTLPPNEIEYLSFAQLEWPICQDGELILCLDTFKIQTISYHSQDLEEELPHFSVWHGGFPSPYLTLSVLFDRFPNEEFTYRGKSDTARLGRPAKTFTKLSFNLDWEQGEIILGIGCAVAHHNQELSIKFFTNFGRSVIFGGPILGDWHPITGIAGIYCSSAIFCHTFPVSHFLSVMTSSDGGHNLIVDDVATIEVTTWPQENVTFDKNQSVLGFVSRSDLTSISGITVYAESLLEEARLTGIKIYHFDRNPDLLERHSRKFTQTYNSSNRGSLCQIQGFRFCFELGLVELGNTESVLQRDIAVSKPSPTVYWVFNGSLSYLSESASDINITFAADWKGKNALRG
ncbi:hypothetical protein LOZ65_003342 [Ophidiomyces ophidiicola]|nr:hypothetical protein LOZ65_003342 [Ophidiomyces ophidiicola]